MQHALEYCSLKYAAESEGLGLYTMVRRVDYVGVVDHSSGPLVDRFQAAAEVSPEGVLRHVVVALQIAYSLR